jgi:hypothetical protein
MKVAGVTRLFAAGAASVALALGVAAPALAAGNGSVGSFTIADHGQGCWAGGSLWADGSASGSGGCAFMTPAGEEVASISPESWSFTDSTHTAVNFCAEFTGKKGPVFPIGTPVPQCLTVPVGTAAPVNLFEDTYGKVTLH